MSERNVDLLRKVAAFLREHPERHDQTTWFARCAPSIQEAARDCNTVGCVAGWALPLDGVEEWPSSGKGWNEAGRAALGLSSEESSWLFDDVRDEPTMPAVLEALADGADIERCEAIEAGGAS